MKILGRLKHKMLWFALRKQCQTATADMTIFLFTFDLYYDMDIDQVFSLYLINTSDKNVFYIPLWAIGLTWVSQLFLQFSLIITLNPLITLAFFRIPSNWMPKSLASQARQPAVVSRVISPRFIAFRSYYNWSPCKQRLNSELPILL